MTLRFLLPLLFLISAPLAIHAQTSLIPTMTGPTTAAWSISASSTYPSLACGNAGWQAADGAPATAWFTNGPPPVQLTVVAPSAVSPTQYSIKGWSSACPSSDATRAPTAWTLYCADSTPAVIIDSRSGQLFANNEIKTYSLAGSPSCVNFKLDVTGNGGNNYLSLTEFQLYGPAPPPPPPPAFTPQIKINLPLPRGPGIDLLAGTVPTIPSNDVSAGGPRDYWDTKVVIFGRQQSSLAISGPGYPVISDSIGDGVDVTQINPAAFNYGIGYDTPAGILNRLAGHTSLHASRALIMIGGAINAIEHGVPVATIEAQLDAIFAWRTGPFIWVPITPTSNAATNAAAAAINAHAAATLASCATCVIVDVSGVLAPGGVQVPGYFIDGYHLTGAGWAAIVPLLQAALAPYL